MSEITDELGGWDEEDFTEAQINAQSEREEGWRKGVHTTSDGQEIKLTEMDEHHLRNIIAYFSGYDTSPLYAELKRRKL